jgi:two-component system, sensor histidine kinase and response regulator
MRKKTLSFSFTLDKPPVYSRRFWGMVYAVLALALVGAVLVPYLVRQARIATEQANMDNRLQRLVTDLEQEVAGASVMGGVTLMGLNDALLKAAATGLVADPESPAVMERLAVARVLFGAADAFMISATGTVLVHATDGARYTGENLSFRPYFQQAMRGVSNAYVAEGTTVGSRGIFYAAPLHADSALGSQVIGVVVLKLNSLGIERVLRGSGSEAMLLSPQGVVYSTTRAEWALHMTPPADPVRVGQIRALRQFGARFAVTAPPVLPFDVTGDVAQIRDNTYLVKQAPVRWSDPSGAWQVVSLYNTGLLMPTSEQLTLGTSVFVALAVAGLLFVNSLQNRRRIAASLDRQNTLGTALEASPMAVVLTRLDGTIDWVNPQFERDTGYTLAELRNQHFTAIIQRDSQMHGLKELTATVLAGKPWRGEFINVRKDGSQFPADVLITPVLGRNGQVQAFVNLQEDTTQARLLQAQLAEQLVFKDNLVETIPLPVFYKDAQARFLGVNRAYEEAFGARRDDLIGKQVVALEHIPLALRTRYQQEDESVIQQASSVQRQMAMLLADGHMHQMLYLARGFRRKDGSLGGMIGTFVDISEQEQIQQELRRAKDAADAASRAKGDFLANMSHEIRTPMNAIIGMAYLVMKTPLNARQADYVAKIQQSGQNLLGIIDDILDISKVEAAKLVVEHVAFNLDTVISNVVNLVAYKTQARGLSLTTDIAADVPHALIGDPLRLGQVLVNYVNNAVKFTASGGIVMRVTVDSAASPADEVVNLPGNAESVVVLRFEVRDTGIGLSPEQAGRLFKSFEQADASTTRQFGGTGLGLAICKGLATLMGGEVGVQSVLGQGATFWFTARLGHGGGASAKAQLQGHIASELAGAAFDLDTLLELAGARILLVEDNEINQQVASEMLRDAGFDVDIADNGQIALDYVARQDQRDEPYDLVLMDLQMPVMDGLTATALLRSNPRYAQLPIAAMTANAMQEDRDRCARAGMNGFITKPFEPDDLWRTVAALVRPRDGLGEPMPSVRSPLQALGGTPDKTALPLNIEGLDTALGLRRLMGQRARYLTLLRKFVGSQSAACTNIRAALALDDRALAERLAHTLKGVAGGMAAVPLSDAAGRLEASINTGAVGADIEFELQNVSLMLDALVSALQKELPPEAVEQPSLSANPQQLYGVCRHLARLLKDNDFEAEELLAKNTALLKSVFGAGFPAIKTAVDGFNFDIALLALQSACATQGIEI